MRSRFPFFLRVGIALFAVLVIAFFAWTNATRGVAVTVSNSTGDEITDLRIKFSGGIKSAPKLKSAESYTCKVNPKSESHLVVEFVDASGRQHSHEIDVYFERNYRGSVDITIRPSGKVEWKDRIEGPFIL